jgi:hypothetical protein
MSYKFWNDKEDSIIKQYFPTTTAQEIKNIYLPHRSLHAIRERRKTLGMEPKEGIRNTKYFFNQDYFLANTPEVYYWAGFIAADGHIKQTKRNRNVLRLRIRLQLSEQNHLSKFFKALDLEKPFYAGQTKSKKYPDKTYYYCEADVASTKLCQDLITKFKIVPRKTWNFEFPDIKDDLLLKSFLIGYIDGDGSIIVNAKKNFILKLIGSYNFLSFVKDKFDLWYPTQNSANVNRLKPIWQYCIEGTRAVAIIEDLLAIQTPKLERKWNKLYEYQNLKEVA